MKTPSKVVYDQVKGILKRVPGVQRLISRIKNDKIRIRELSNLIKENRIAIWHPFFRMENDETMTHEIVHDVVKEFLDLYGIVHLGRKTAAAIDSLSGAILLWAPLALLEIPSTHEEYMERIRHETRRDIRLAERQGYEFKEFVWNDHLSEIFEINTSKEVRQSQPMLGWYREPVKPRHHTKEELQYRKYYGAFKDGKLCAYFHLWVCGDFAVGRHIIGHAQHLKYGIMNGLISWTVRECIRNSQIRWLYYGVFSGLISLNSFKKHAGFQEYAVVLDLEGDQELLEYSKRSVKTLWRV